MDNGLFIHLAKHYVLEFTNEQVVKLMKVNPIEEKDIYVVWICKTLQNNKALLSTTLGDGMYYEVTYNGDKQELYFDAYEKVHNEAIPLIPKNEEK